MLIASPISLALSVAGGIWAGRRAFRPLAEVTRAAAEIDTADLGRRLDVDPRAGDLAGLVTAFNSLLARLERAVADLDQYAAHVSHEVRTPLAASIAELEVALRRPRTAEQWTATATRVLADLQALAKLADDLLQLARQAAGHPPPGDGFAVAEVLAGLRGRAAAAAAERGVTLGWQVAGDLDAWLAGSPVLIASAVWNLIDNAVRYTPAGGRVEVGAAAGGGDLRVTVADSGPGIAAAARPSIFDPFVRDRAGGDGTGVGLAIARRTVEAHRGTIAAAASELGGALLTVTLPAAQNRARADSPTRK